MASTARSRRSQVETGTKTQLIEAGERLFGRHGLDGVSLRQIAALAGSSNSSVVQYHFGDKEGLIQAIFLHRLPPLEIARGDLLAEVRRRGRMEDPRALIEALLRPNGEARDREGRRSYAGFLLGLRTQRALSGPRAAATPAAPLAQHIVDLIQAVVGPMPDALFHTRMLAASTLFWHALMDVDEELAASGRLAVAEEAVLGHALDAGTMLLTAPVSAAAAEAFATADKASRRAAEPRKRPAGVRRP